MLPACFTFENEIRQLRKYMTSVDCYNQLLSMKNQVAGEVSEKIEELRQLNVDFYKRKCDYAAVIISLYGCFERFVENFIKDCLLILTENNSGYSGLPDIIKANHLELSVLLLGKTEQSKYSYLSKESVITKLNDCIQNNRCNLNYEAFCQHSANFRVQVLRETLRNIGFADLVNEIKQNEELKNMYIQENGDCNYDNLSPDIVFGFLNDLADRRNKVAHGYNVIEDILSFDLQRQLIEKVYIFGKAMDASGFTRMLPYLTYKCYKIEKVYNIAERPTKLLCFELRNSKVRLGDIIIHKRHEQYTYSKIESIQVEGVDYNEVETINAQNIGVKLSKTRKLDEEYWLYTENYNCY